MRFAVPGFGAALAGAVDLDDNGYPGMSGNDFSFVGL